MNGGKDEKDVGHGKMMQTMMTSMIRMNLKPMMMMKKTTDDYDDDWEDDEYNRLYDDGEH